MSETLFQLVPLYGPPILLIMTFLSCLAMPVPTSLMMLASGAFVASGDLSLWTTAGAALVGAILGDQAGFQIGRAGGALLSDRLESSPRRRAALERARETVRQRGALGVFLTRWLLSPLGPYVNLVSGAAGLDRRVFTLFAALGEAVWVALYIGLGAMFADQIQQAADITGNALGLIAAGAVTFWLGLSLRRARRRSRA